eukprot:TRINITY_DN13391_c0_g1_i1.p1 TRINITY_DN13391_c0_g1~~TRINITY_DN13391_c0_g1_i1.p1  ORF type:complete len:500 (+),score=70.61 TRINITY_DN13391_c0_g1_i1:236-1735(+)
MNPDDKYLGGFQLHQDKFIWPSGGAGYLLSKALMTKCDLSACPDNQYEDYGMGHCFGKSYGCNVQASALLGLNPDTPEKMVEWAIWPSPDHVPQKHKIFGANKDFRPITYHYIKPERFSMMRYSGNTPFPKRLHQIWVGKKAPPTDWLRTCSELHPGWEYFLWTDASLKELMYDSKYQAKGSMVKKLLPILERNGVGTASGKMVLNGVADLVRIEVLYRYGGFALDADSQCLNPFDELVDQGRTNDYLSVWEFKNSLTSAGTQASHQYSPSVYMALSEIPYLTAGPAWMRTGPCLNSMLITHPNKCGLANFGKLQSFCGGSVTSSRDAYGCVKDWYPLSIYDATRFYPYHHSNKDQMHRCIKDTHNAFTLQHWRSTSLGYKEGKYPEAELRKNHGHVFTLSPWSAEKSGQWKPTCNDGVMGFAATSGDARVVFTVHHAVLEVIGARCVTIHVIGKFAKFSVCDSSGMCKDGSQDEAASDLAKVIVEGGFPQVRLKAKAC